jgi:hypothetical protein
MQNKKSPHAAAAQAIRTALKSTGLRCRVTSHCFFMGDAVDVTIFDARPELMALVQKLCRRYQEGHFDGMTDCYEYSNTNSDLPQVKFVHVINDVSDATLQEVYDYLRQHFAGGDELPPLYADGAQLQFADTWADTLVHRMFARADSPYWAHVAKQRQAAA